MCKVVRVTGMHAKVADCIGAKLAVVSVKPLPEKKLAKIAEKRARNEDVIDLLDMLNVKAFKSPVSQNRRPLGHSISQRVCVR